MTQPRDLIKKMADFFRGEEFYEKGEDARLELSPDDVRCMNYLIHKALEQEPCEDEYIKVPKKALKYRTAGMVAYNAEWLKNHFDIERAVICGAQEPCEDAISRHAVLDMMQMRMGGKELYKAVYELPPVTPQPKTGQFAKWVAREIFDDMWEYNKDAFAEIACRKLAKLGIVRAKGDVWELVDPQESEGQMEFSYHPINPLFLFQDDGLSKEDRTLIDGMRNAAYVCGYRGEDIEYAVHQALKRMDRYDLLPPCERDKTESEDAE